ncbi:ATP-dependent helicase HrpB [Pseudactinotalea sp. HY158]|uniref:ATP-dependent helicase HrpB n=1 Tax=Pseudactinotalea sp. HY158 TaxID=2654547 RepID=UPI00129C728A|nr:ATP-dependent helicase HrpB [Pseudactinotalea sp. HY158]QGH69505.1 ATP-dependent helicase HrpB [Pseudactinotalea sp. HY158]
MVSSRPFALDAVGAGLAIRAAAPELSRVLAAGGSAPLAVVQAPPGSGKTTLVPPLLSEHLRSLPGHPPGRVVVTQPRRVAVRAAARRLAALDGSPIGQRVGYAVRGERRTSAQALVEFCTPGLLLRRLLGDPDLPGVGAVVLDEVHERDLDTDLLLGLLGEVRELREDLALVAMSATIDAPAFARLLGGGEPAPIVASPAVQHPLRIDYAPAAGPRTSDRGVERAFLDHVAGVAARAARAADGADKSDKSVDALVFLPGAWEVGHVAARLRSDLGGEADVLELHSRRPAAEQDDAIAGRHPGGRPRIVVATAIAESSLTVPGVGLVIDACLAREPRRDATRDMSGLVTVAASRAAMDQRAGRAARLGPGRAIRCIDERAHAAAPAAPRSQLSTADLTGAALTLAVWGAPGGRGLRLPEPVPAAAMAEAVSVLRRLGAVDAAGRATELGRRLAEIPADPRLARALVDGARLARAHAGPAPARLAAEIVALIAGDLRAPGADLAGRWRQLRSGTGPEERRWRTEADRLERLERREPIEPPRVQAPPAGAAAATASPGMIVALAHPDRIARLVAAPGTYLLASGTRAALPPGSPLIGEPWLGVAEAARASGRSAAGTGAVIRAAAPIEADDLLVAAAHLRSTRVDVVVEQGRVRARETTRLGAIELATTPVPASLDGARRAILAALADSGPALFDPSREDEQWRRRLAFLHRHLGPPWPAVDAAGLVATADTWLEPHLRSLAGGRALRRVDLGAALRSLLPWPEASRLEELAPERLRVPSGSRCRVEYPDDAVDPDARPVVAVKLQECFGLTTTPTLANGRVRVLFHLLSPAGRPLAVTDDLAAFWAGPYAGVRAENRGRYPKHPWPEDPASHRPTGLTNRRLGER